jgi:hypothetical protein
MTTRPVPTDGLIVARAELAEALGIVAQLMGRRATGASLRFEDGWLFVTAGIGIAKAPAEGSWPLTIIVGPSWVRRLAKSLPPGDPVFLRVENGRLYANKYSEPCGWSTAKDPLDPSLGKVTEACRISEAATVLKPFLIGREDIQALVEIARKRGPITWVESEETMISAVSKAWAHLAPLGVETSDLRNLVDGAVRNAWDAKKDK